MSFFFYLQIYPISSTGFEECGAILSISALVIKDSQKALFFAMCGRERDREIPKQETGGEANEEGGLNDMFVWLKKGRENQAVGKKADGFGFLVCGRN